MMSFDVIYADPPWKFHTRSPKGGGRSPERHYPTMSLAEMCRLPVGDLAARNAALFLWVTWPTILRDVPELLKAWGFEYRTVAFVWVKQNPKNGGLFCSLGYYSRGNTEPCLLAVRGRMPVAVHDVHQVVMAPRGRHSEKPAEVYDRIERLYPGRSYLELFARRKGRPGWSYWGNEIESDIAIPELATMP